MTSFTPIATSNEIDEIEKQAQKKYQLNSEILMESAGKACAKQIYKLYDLLNDREVLILCGPGNNGGDGFVIARYLISQGVQVHIVAPHFVSSSLLKKQRFLIKNTPIHSIENLKLIKEKTSKSTIIIDALFGIGLSKKIEHPYFDIIEFINNSNNPIISIDIPSGLNSNTGCLMDIGVKAHYTLALGLSKIGFYLMKGTSHTGTIKILDIGFPASLIEKYACSHFLVNSQWVQKTFPKRSPEDHKAKHGHLLVIAGKEGFFGAGILSCLSAYRMGTGYVTWALQDNSFHPSLKEIPEVLTQSLSDQNLYSNKTAVVIGPGLGINSQVQNQIQNLKKQKLPAIIDADAITVCFQERLFPLPKNWIITPHSGELARFFNIKGKDIDQDRCYYAKKANSQLHCPVLLKGHHSVLAHNENIYIIPTGNSSLAKAGTGDVLAGFIGALISRGLPSFHAGLVGAYIHGKLADEWVLSGKDPDTLMAQDLKDLLPSLLHKIKNK